MSKTRHEVREVFIAAVALKTPEERAHFLRAACRGRPALRRRVEELLRADEEADDFLRINNGDWH